MDNWNEGSRIGKGEVSGMNELKVIDFKYGDWRDWFINKKQRWDMVEKSRLYVIINNKEFSVIAPVKISEITISYLHQSGKPKFLNSFGYRNYNVNYIRSLASNCSDKLEITIEFMSFEHVEPKGNRRKINDSM